MRKDVIVAVIVFATARGAYAQISITIPQLTDVDVSVGYVGLASKARGIDSGGAWRLAIESVFASSRPTCSKLSRSLDRAKTRVADARQALQRAAKAKIEAVPPGVQNAPTVDQIVADADLKNAQDALKDRQTELDAITTALLATGDDRCPHLQLELGVGYSQLLSHGRSNLFFLKAAGVQYDVLGWVRDLPQASIYVAWDVTNGPRPVGAYAGATIAFSSISAQFQANGHQYSITGDTFSPALRLGAYSDCGAYELFAEAAVESSIFNSPHYAANTGELVPGLPSSVGFLQVMATVGVQIHLQDPKL